MTTDANGDVKFIIPNLVNGQYDDLSYSVTDSSKDYFSINEMFFI